MRMNLRQIVRNQKLQKFDLTSLISESQRYNDFLDKAPKVSKPGKEGTRQGSSDVLIRTALGYKSKGFKGSDGAIDTSQQTAYQNALTYLQGAVETGDLKRRDLPGEFSKDVPSAVGDRYKDKEQDTKKDDEEKVKVSKKKKDTKKNKKDTEQSIDPKPEVTKADVKAAQNNIENAGEPNIKDKSLGGVIAPVFKATIPPATTDEQFKENMKNSGSKSIDPPVSFSKSQQKRFFSKVPQVYAPVIERMLNQTKGKSSITDFMEGVGAGQPSSQAGEIITMAAITMNDEDAAEFFNVLRERVKDSDYPKDAWIDKGWVDSAQQVRNGTIARYNGAYGEGNWKIDKGCWDSATEVEAMGLKDYTKNKGFSTDTYMRLEVDGKPVLDEISLKKDLNVNFLNKNTSALVDFAILGSDEAGLFEQLNNLWAEIPDKDRDKKTNPPTFDVAGESLTPREIQSKINDMRSKAFDSLAESNPDLAEQIKLADADRAKVRQRELLGDSLGSEEFLMSMRAAARDFDKIKKEEPLNGILDSLVGGGQSRSKIEGFAKEAIAALEGDNLNNITFGKDDDGNTLDPMVVYKDGVELKTKDEKEAVFGKGKSGSDRIQKIAWYATVLGSAKNPTLNKHRERIEENIKEHTDSVIRTINDIPQMKSGMLNAIREEFPLKALFEGEEAMSLAQYNCDPKVLKEIFEGAESYEDIQDKLGIEEDETGELSLVYRASAGGESIPVAQLEARSDGKGYGNSFKFTLKVHKGFQTALKDGNAAAYEGSGVYEHSINLGNILAEDKQNTLAFHWKKAEDDYPLHYFLRDLNEGSLK